MFTARAQARPDGLGPDGGLWRRLRARRRARAAGPVGWQPSASELTTLGALGSDGRTVRLFVSGELDMATAPQLRAAVWRQVRDGRQGVVLDLRGLSFCDVFGYRLLAHLPALAAEHGAQLEFDNLPAGVRRLADLLDDEDRWPPAR